MKQVFITNLRAGLDLSGINAVMKSKFGLNIAVVQNGTQVFIQYNPNNVEMLFEAGQVWERYRNECRNQSSKS